MNDKKETNRRDFFTAPWDRGAANEPAEVLPSFLTPTVSHLECYSRNAMACQFELMFNMHQFPNAAEISLNAFEQIEQFEEQMSIYRETSEVSFINNHAAQQSVEVEHRLFDLLAISKSIHELTAGAFDITSGPLSDLWGFSRRSGQVPADEKIEKTLGRVGFEHLELNDRFVRFKRSGVAINLGAIGKGYALDHVANSIEQSGITDFIIHGGQSSVIARGSNATLDQQSGWNVGLSHPLIPSSRFAEIRLNDLALGTSGTGRQGFFHQSKRYGHIIDPRSGYPTNHNLSTTVICKSAARADALATGFFVMTLEQIEAICDQDQSILAIIVTAGDDINRAVIKSFNVGDDILKLNRNGSEP